MDEVVYVTQAGLTQLKEELTRRTEVLRYEIAGRLDEAIKMGDLKENADYHAAKEEQAFNEGRITELQRAIQNAEVINETSSSAGIVRLGSTVTITEEGFDDEEEVYQIVGAREADPMKGMISNESPIGKALLGKKAGNTITAQTPGGMMTFSVVKVE